jgi:nitrate reductase NapE component
LFLAVLAVAWIVVLVPPVLRARNDSRSRGDSIGDFQNRLGVLGRAPASRQARRAARATLGSAGAPGRSLAANRGLRSPVRPLPRPVETVRSAGSERASRRRREVVTVLFTAVLLSAAVASALGGSFFWAFQILSDLLLLSYFGGMVWFRGRSAERMRTVRYLPQVRPRPVPAYALRRTASS